MNNVLIPKRDKRTLKSFFPILGWLPNYKTQWLRFDLIAALTLWALLVPEAMAYAGIAGMPPETGLYTAPLALIFYAIFGSSRHLNVGPSSTVAALSASVIAGMGIAAFSEEWISLSILLALITGLVLIVAGLLKLGVLADFLSRPVLDGFIVGVAITIAAGQLDKLVGFEVEGQGFIAEILLFVTNLGMTHWPTLIIGLLSLALLFLIEKYTPKIPGALTVVALGIIISSLLGFSDLGIHIVGDIPAGLPDFGLPGDMTVETFAALLPGAFAIGIVGFAESVAAARSYANEFGYRIDADQEMIALGMANFGAGVSQGFTVDGSLSKSAAAVEAGARTQLVSIFAAIAVLITVLWLTPLFRNLPEAVLGAIVIHAVWRLINFKKIWRYWNIKRLDFWTALVAMVGVLIIGILIGLALAIFLAMIGLIVGAKSRSTVILGRDPDHSSFHSLAYHPDFETFPNILVLRFDGSLFFANAPNFVEAVRLGVSQSDPPPEVVLIDFESVSDIDATTTAMIRQLVDDLAKSGTRVWFARVKENIRTVIRADGVEELVGSENFYFSVNDGVERFQSE